MKTISIGISTALILWACGCVTTKNLPVDQLARAADQVRPGTGALLLHAIGTTASAVPGPGDLVEVRTNATDATGSPVVLPVTIRTETLYRRVETVAAMPAPVPAIMPGSATPAGGLKDLSGVPMSDEERAALETIGR